MFSIRRIHDTVLPRNRAALDEAKAILQTQFDQLALSEVESLPEKLRNPLAHRFKSVLYVAETHESGIAGFALVQHEPVLRFSYLDYIAVAPGTTSRGVGGALYTRVRQEARENGSKAIFFECLPDDPEACDPPEVARANAARLRFYEAFGALPVVGTRYEAPFGDLTHNLPYLVFDGLGTAKLPRRFAQQVVRAVLERKYRDLCPPDYVDAVERSFVHDPVHLRAPCYGEPVPEPVDLVSPAGRIALTVNDQHDIHHVRERGYVESPVRIKAILGAAERSGLFQPHAVTPFPDEHITAVHDPAYVSYLEKACAAVPEGKSVYPYVFPIRNPDRPPQDLSVQAGYYCIDTFTPINRNAWLAARRAVDCALTAAQTLVEGGRLAYALVRPPGHHAERRSFGGFCYFNNAAIAANHLSALGRVAIVDVDYHHGNGQQDIFYRRADVLTVSIHGDPSFAYPYFTGFADETGDGEGEGFNLNIPLPEQIDAARYRAELGRALERVRSFGADFLVVALGLDTAKQDPTGTWAFGPADFRAWGRMIGAAGLPTLVVQEGGYRTRSLGRNALAFFTGLAAVAPP